MERHGISLTAPCPQLCARNTRPGCLLCCGPPVSFIFLVFCLPVARRDRLLQPLFLHYFSSVHCIYSSPSALIYISTDTLFLLSSVSRYVNSYAEKKGFDATRLLSCSWDDMAPSEEDLVREPLLRELSLWPSPATATTKTAAFSSPTNRASTTESVLIGGVGLERAPGIQHGRGGVEETKGEGVLAEVKDPEDGDGRGVRRNGEVSFSGGGKCEVVGRSGWKKSGCIAARFEVLQLLNRKLRDALPFIDLTLVCRRLHVGVGAHSGRLPDQLSNAFRTL